MVGEGRWAIPAADRSRVDVGSVQAANSRLTVLPLRPPSPPKTLCPTVYNVLGPHVTTKRASSLPPRWGLLHRPEKGFRKTKPVAFTTRRRRVRPPHGSVVSVLATVGWGPGGLAEATDHGLDVSTRGRPVCMGAKKQTCDVYRLPLASLGFVAECPPRGGSMPAVSSVASNWASRASSLSSSFVRLASMAAACCSPLSGLVSAAPKPTWPIRKGMCTIRWARTAFPRKPMLA